MPPRPSTESPQSTTNDPALDAPNLMQPNWSSSNDLEPLADSTPPNSPQQQCQSSPDNLQLAASEVMQPKWSGFNDLQPLMTHESANPTMLVSQPEVDDLLSSVQAPMQSSLNRSYNEQHTAASATEACSTQPLPSEFIWAHSNWSISNDLYRSEPC